MSFAEELKKLEKIDPNDLAAWPMFLKVFICVLVAAAVGAGGYFLDLQKQAEDLVREEKQLESLKKDYETKQAKASRLDAYKKQMDDMQRIFGEMLRQLPGKTEVAALLVDVSQVGVASGLEFDLFKPQPETPVEFYAELPIQIKVRGTYHEFGNFVSGVAALPRIVTLHDYTIQPGKGKDKDILTMEAIAKTYRYLDESEIAAEQNRKRKKAKPGKKK